MEEAYNVVRIIDEKNIVINAGKENYIKKGDKFEIYSIGKEIKDLNGNSLGTLDTIKETVVAVTVFPKMSICQKLTKTSLSPLLKFTKEQIASIEDANYLNVDTTEFEGGLEQDLTIHVGDFARLTE